MPKTDLDTLIAKLQSLKERYGGKTPVRVEGMLSPCMSVLCPAVAEYVTTDSQTDYPYITLSPLSAEDYLKNYERDCDDLSWE